MSEHRLFFVAGIIFALASIFFVIALFGAGAADSSFWRLDAESIGQAQTYWSNCSALCMTIAGYCFLRLPRVVERASHGQMGALVTVLAGLITFTIIRHNPEEKVNLLVLSPFLFAVITLVLVYMEESSSNNNN